MVDPVPGLDALVAALGSTLVASEPMPWGDARSTWRIDLLDGRRLVARRFSGPDLDRAGSIAERMRSVASAGIPVPPARTVATATDRWLVTDHVPGRVGASLLVSPDSARALGTSMGRLWARLSRVDLAEVDGIRLADDDPRAAFVHGDFAPVNVIVGRGAEILALLDFEHAHLGDPLEDIAWWGWVVRHHHPEVWLNAWPALCSAAGIDVREHDAVLRALMLSQLERRVATASDERTRHRWRALRDEAAAWGAQST